LSETNLPKTIWFLWLQGINNMPLVVSKCYESWQRHHIGWEVIFLDETNIRDYVDLSTTGLTNQAISDILRINILAKHGGVWVDATCFCTKCLDEWLPDYMAAGFFTFNRPGPDRMISSWFMASDPNNYITTAYQQAVNNYWTSNPGLTFFETSKWYSFKRRLKWMKPRHWFGFFATKILKVYPYFWFHYLFETIYLSDKKVWEIWESTPKTNADIPHKLQFAGLFNPLNDEIKSEIDHKSSPLYKLTWKFEEQDLKAGTIMDYLLNNDERA